MKKEKNKKKKIFKYNYVYFILLDEIVTIILNNYYINDFLCDKELMFKIDH